MTRVLLVSIDGLAGFYWNDPNLRLPTLRWLAERGVVASRMEAVFPSTTWPTHVSLVTGVAPRTHGIVGNHILERASGRVEDLTGLWVAAERLTGSPLDPLDPRLLEAL